MNAIDSNRSILVTTDFLSERIATVNYHSQGIIPLLVSIFNRFSHCVDEFPRNFFTPNKYFDPQIFFNLSGFDYSKELPPIVDINDVSPESIRYFENKFKSYDIVVGWELMPLTEKIFDLIGIRYINMWLHPVRFMDDEILAVKTNCNKFLKFLKKYSISEDSFYVNAAYCKAVIKRRSKIKIDKNSAAIFGQVSNDKTLRTQNGFLSLSKNYLDEILRISASYNKIYFCKHPLQKNDSEFKFLKSQVKNIENISANGYEIIANENIDLVAAISSSITIESYYFGKDVVVFNKPTVDINGEEYCNIGVEFFDPKFWANCFGYKGYEQNGVFRFGEKNKFRNVLDAYYSYGIMKDF
ncbi:MAG: hypothetical protein LBE51_14085 [Acidovorax sp.]|jgi:hypothetical protein|nr:hypothetical protein [Acidovorax sp.]